MLGCIADDVTGATDLAINLVQGGMRVIQILDVPDAETLADAADADAIVVALKSRSIEPFEAIAQTLDSLRALQQIGVDRFYFKYCSTFDSTERGNIGRVAEALMKELDVGQTVFCPAFPRAGRTVYQGHLFVGDKLLNESGMQNHPLNPMTDANLVRFLSKQSSGQVGLLPFDTVNQSASACSEQLDALKASGVSLVVTDVCNNSDLATLAQSLASMKLVTGGSGLARYLPDAYRASGVLESAAYESCMPDVSGRGLILAGSCSIATNAQVDWMRDKCPSWQVDVAALIEDESAELDKITAWATEFDSNQTLMVSSTSMPDIVSVLQTRFGGDAVAAAIERFLAKIAKTFVRELAVTRLVLAGGETSGAIVRELGIRSLQIGPEICAGVPWTETKVGIETEVGTDSNDTNTKLALALKSGNFGAEDFFSTALEMLS